MASKAPRSRSEPESRSKRQKVRLLGFPYMGYFYLLQFVDGSEARLCINMSMILIERQLYRHYHRQIDSN